MFPYLGYGLGFRVHYYQTIVEHLAAKIPGVDWFEVMTEDYLVPGGRPLYHLERLREHSPIVMHGVSLSIGGTDAIDYNYLAEVKALADRVNPVWISDHLCWTRVGGHHLHDLLPLPYTEEALKHVVERVKKVQDFLGRQILLENVSSYITYKDSQITEWEFLTAVVEQADCFVLLDINNIYVSAFNHGFNPQKYIQAVPVARVQQFHLAGHDNQGDYIVDTHDAPVVGGVWDLYAQAVQRFPHASTLIERDGNFPPFSELLSELAHARAVGENAKSAQCVSV